jgi:hypothetical protein
MNALDQGDWLLVYNGISQPTKLFFEMTNLQTGGLYRFTVSALNGVGEGPWSPEETFLCAATASAPSQPIVIAQTKTQISISWEPPVDDGGSRPTGYQIFSKLAV